MLPDPVRHVSAKTYEQWVARIGAERYREACVWAWRTAAGTGRDSKRSSEAWPCRLENVPHDLADAWHEGGSTGERLRLALRFYDDMPCYANTMYLKHGYDEFGQAEKAAFWVAYRAALDAVDDRLADPVAYSLWVDFFEDQETVAEAWRETTRRDGAPFDRRLRRVLMNAGPVPWTFKDELFDQLCDDQEWHLSIYGALIGSAFDVYGQLDAASAHAWLTRISVPADTPQMDALRERLARAQR